MCGRYTLSTPADLVAEFFVLEEAIELQPRFNIAPTQTAAVIREEEGRRQLRELRWGLIPSWARDVGFGHRTLNARAETAAVKPSFRQAFRHRRCLVAADGFYEWAKVGGRKVPHYFYLRDGGPLALAGLWESWRDPAGEPIESFTILTTEANPLVTRAHARMPVILPPSRHAQWLDPRVIDPAAVQPFLEPYPAGEMGAHPVSAAVNSPANDSPRCIEPVGPPLLIDRDPSATELFS